MDNLNLTNSKRPYRVSFIIISGLLSFVAAGLALYFVQQVFEMGRMPSGVVLFSVLILWNVISVYLAKKLWPSSQDRTSLINVKGDRETVRQFRNLTYVSYLMILSGILVSIFYLEGIIPKDDANVALALILFCGGFITLLGIFSYYSGIKGISANEATTYPFQFLNSEEKKIAIEKKIRFLKTSLFLVPIMLIIFNSVFNILDWSSVVKISVVVLGGTFYQMRQLRNIV